MHRTCGCVFLLILPITALGPLLKEVAFVPDQGLTDLSPKPRPEISRSSQQRFLPEPFLPDLSGHLVQKEIEEPYPEWRKNFHPRPVPVIQEPLVDPIPVDTVKPPRPASVNPVSKPSIAFEQGKKSKPVVYAASDRLSTWSEVAELARANLVLKAEPTGPLDNLSCDRQPLRKDCPSGYATQPTMRWFLAEDNSCRTYVWGWCVREGIRNDPTIRTKEQCDQLCIPPARSPTG